jgi:hypothetical protein
MIPMDLGNMHKLRLIDNDALLQKLVLELRIECSNSKILVTRNPHTVYLLMLCCNAYDFNEATVKCYSNLIVRALWRVVGRAVAKLAIVYGTRSRGLKELMSSRSVPSFENCHMVVPSSSLIRTTVTGQAALDKRQLAISSGDREKVVLGCTTPPVFVSGPVVFVSYSFMILDRSGYKDGATKRDPRSSKCECSNLLKCFDLETREECNLCLCHGVETAARIVTLELRSTKFLLRSNQCIHPSLHMDRDATLPHIVNKQTDAMLKELGYSQIRSLKFDGSYTGLFTSESGEHSELISKFRQCVCIGTVKVGLSTVILWMIRPTVNYLEAVYECSRAELSMVKSRIRSVAKSLRSDINVMSGITFEEMYTRSGWVKLIVKGALLASLMSLESSKDLDLKISSVSMGGSILNVTILQPNEDGVCVTPVIMNINIIRSLTHQTNKSVLGMQFYPEMRKVRVKFVNMSSSQLRGPSLTLGMNGGFQWIGSPSRLSDTIVQYFRYAANKMATPEFSRALKMLVIGISSVYPGGVPRANLD